MPSMLKGIYEKQQMAGWSEERYRELKATYYDMVHQLDARLGELVAAMKETGVYDGTALFFFSDHGDFTGDFGLAEKAQNTFYDCQCNIPLMIKPAAGTAIKPRVTEALAELADAGVFCGVLFTPTLPFATDDDATVRGVVEGAAAAGARFVYHMTGVTMRDRQRDHFLDRIAAVDPTLPERYRAAFGDRYFCNSPRATENRALFRSLCKQHGLLWRMSDIIAAYKPSQPMGAQTSLF